MERRFGPLETDVPVIGQGTWNMETDDRTSAIDAVRRGVDLGLTHIDTAEMYGGGRVESLLNEALHGIRDRVFLVSKVLPSNGDYAGTIAACEASLQRLGTDHLDVYLLHWPGHHPLEETLRAFETLREQGKIRAYGVSNFDAEELRSAVELAGEGRIVCNQVLYHLEERDIEHELLDACRAAKVALVAYSPFGSGRFPAPASKGGQLLDEIGRAHGVSARSVALSFLCRDPAVFAIPKSSTAAHVEQNAQALTLQLSAGEIEQIDAAFGLRKKRRHLPTI